MTDLSPSKSDTSSDIPAQADLPAPDAQADSPAPDSSAANDPAPDNADLTQDDNATAAADTESTSSSVFGEMIDVFGDMTLLKRPYLDHPGHGDHRVNMGEDVEVELTVMEVPEIGLSYPDMVLRFIQGDGDVEQAYEMMVALMREGEKIQMVAGFGHLYGDRTTMLSGKEVPPKSNFKMDMAIKKNYGTPDYPSMDFQTRFNHADVKKQRGNTLFRQKEYHLAISSYKRAANIVDPNLGCQFPNESPENLQKLLEFRCFLQCNLSVTQLKVEANDSALMAAEEAVKIRPTYSKGYFRLAQAHEKLGNLNQSIVNHKKALKLDEENKTIHVELARLSKMKKTTETKQKEMCNKMFWGGNGVPAKSKSQTKEESNKPTPSTSSQSSDSVRSAPRTAQGSVTLGAPIEDLFKHPVAASLKARFAAAMASSNAGSFPDPLAAHIELPRAAPVVTPFTSHGSASAETAQIVAPIARATTADDRAAPIARAAMADDLAAPIARAAMADDLAAPIARPAMADDLAAPIARPAMADDLAAPIARPAMADDLAAPITRAATADDRAAPIARAAMADDLAAQIARPAMADDLAAPIARPAMADDLAAPIARPAMADDLAAPITRAATADDLATPNARAATADDIKAPNARPATADDLAAPIARQATVDDLAAPIASPNTSQVTAADLVFLEAHPCTTAWATPPSASAATSFAAKFTAQLASQAAEREELPLVARVAAHFAAAVADQVATPAKAKETVLDQAEENTQKSPWLLKAGIVGAAAVGLGLFLYKSF